MPPIDRASLSGLEVLRAIARGDLPLPPAHTLTGITGIEFERGFAAFVLEPESRHYNPMGVVHGGILSMILDSAMGCAVYSTLPPGVSYTTVDLHVTFVRPVTAESGQLRAEGRALHTGNRVATSEGRLVDATGRLVAHGVETCFVLGPSR